MDGGVFAEDVLWPMLRPVGPSLNFKILRASPMTAAAWNLIAGTDLVTPVR